MTYVITQNCCNDASCVPVCPVNCIHPTPDEPGYATAEMLYIDPDGCIDCGACLDACPVDAIAPDFELSADLLPFADLNAAYYRDASHQGYDTSPQPHQVSTWEVAADPRPLRVAIVGSGPAGSFAASELLSQRGLRVEVDMYEKLPAPWGLVRYGVAPDHQETKAVAEEFSRMARRTGFRLFLNVEVGRDVTHDELRTAYHAVIYAVGASADRALRIPGEGLVGSHSATEFVAWYNGHPDHADQTFDLSHEHAVVVGNGNVALDVARILVTEIDELAHTDIAEHALAQLAESRVRTVSVLGRRGPAQAGFTTPELLGLMGDDSFDITARADEIDGTPRAALMATYKADLVGQLGSEPGAGRKSIALRFLTSPVEILGEHRVSRLVTVRNSLVTSATGAVSAEPTTHSEVLDCGLILRSVGYRGRPTPGVPFDESPGTIPHVRGRVTGQKGVYVTGWIKRGPSGVIGTNKQDSKESVKSLLEDYAAGQLTAPTVEIPAVPGSLGIDGWKLIDIAERKAGQMLGRPRLKLVDRGTMVAVAEGRELDVMDPELGHMRTTSESEKA